MEIGLGATTAHRLLGHGEDLKIEMDCGPGITTVDKRPDCGESLRVDCDPSVTTVRSLQGYG